MHSSIWDLWSLISQILINSVAMQCILHLGIGHHFSKLPCQCVPCYLISDQKADIIILSVPVPITNSETRFCQKKIVCIVFTTLWKKCVITVVYFKLMDCKIYGDPRAMIENIFTYIIYIYTGFSLYICTYVKYFLKQFLLSLLCVHISV